MACFDSGEIRKSLYIIFASEISSPDRYTTHSKSACCSNDCDWLNRRLSHKTLHNIFRPKLTNSIEYIDTTDNVNIIRIDRSTTGGKHEGAFRYRIIRHNNALIQHGNVQSWPKLVIPFVWINRCFYSHLAQINRIVPWVSCVRTMYICSTTKYLLFIFWTCTMYVVDTLNRLTMKKKIKLTNLYIVFGLYLCSEYFHRQNSFLSL